MKNIKKTILFLSTAFFILMNNSNVQASTTTKNTEIWESMSTAERTAYSDYIKNFIKSNPDITDVDFADVNLDDDLEVILFVESYNTEFESPIIEICILDYENGKLEELFSNINQGWRMAYSVLRSSGGNILTDCDFYRYDALYPSDLFYENSYKVEIKKGDIPYDQYSWVEDVVVIDGDLETGVNVVSGRIYGGEDFYEFYYDAINDVYVPNYTETADVNDLINSIWTRTSVYLDDNKDTNVITEVLSLDKLYTTTSQQTSQINVTLNGSTLNFEQPPIIQDGRTLVPMRAIFEAMGANVEWDNDTRTVIGTKGDTVIKMTIDNPIITVNGNHVTLDVAPTILNGRTMVPARAVAESFNAKVDWDKTTQTVIITQ